MATEFQEALLTSTTTPVASVFDSDWFNSSNVTRITMDPIRDSLTTVIPMTFVYALLLITGVIGNICTCVVITRNKYMHTATNYYLFSLAVSDLLLLVSGLPVELYQLWYKRPYVFGEFFCVFRGLTSETSTNASILTITSFTIERYVAICHPLRAHTMSKLSRAIKFIVGIWICSALSAIPLAIQFGIIYAEVEGEILLYTAQCTVKNPVTHAFEISTFMFFILPMTLISVLYMLIGVQLRRSSRMNRRNGNVGGGTAPVTVANGVKGSYGGAGIEDRLKSSSTNHSQSSKSLSQKLSKQSKKGAVNSAAASRRAVLKMLVAVVVAFFICWAPFHAQRLMAIYVTAPTEMDIKIYEVLLHISGVSYYVSATINPILYSILSLKFRQAFKETLASCIGRRVTRAGSRYSTDAAQPRKSTLLETTDLTMMSESSPRSSLAKVVAFIKPLTSVHHQSRNFKIDKVNNNRTTERTSFVFHRQESTPAGTIASSDGGGSSISNSSLQMLDDDAFDGAEIRSIMSRDPNVRR